MCSGYYLEKAEWMHRIAGAARRHSLMRRISSTIAKPVTTCGDVHLSDIAPVIAPDGKGGGRVFPMMWGFSTKLDGFIPSVDIDILEDTSDPVLLDAWARHRCLIPASWYFEWERVHPVISYDTFGDQTPESERRSRRQYRKMTLSDSELSDSIGDRYMLQTRGSSITLLGGIYQIEDHGGVKFPHFMILMHYAAPNIMFIHNKMPVIFNSSDKELLNDWLNTGAMPPWTTERIFDCAVTDVVYEKCPVPLRRERRPFYAGHKP